MVGGLVLGALRFSAQNPHATNLENSSLMYFNLGRIASYVVLGGLITMRTLFQLSTSVLERSRCGLVMLFLEDS